jgi:hypothetical protein
MERPNMDWFKHRLQGRYGHAVMRRMESVELQTLVNYIDHLEEKLNEQQNLPTVQENVERN